MYFLFKQKTAYEMRISDWSSDVCSSDLAMYSHNMVGSNDLEASKKFYDATFQAIGGKPAIVDDKGRLIYMHNGGLFLVGAPIDGEPASVGNGCTIGFAMDGPEQANAWPIGRAQV